MAQTPQARADNDIYTILAAIALAVVLGTIGFVIYRSIALFGTALPGMA